MTLLSGKSLLRYFSLNRNDWVVAPSESQASSNCECAAMVWWNNCQTCIKIIGELSYAWVVYSDPYHNTCISVRSRSGGEDSLDLTMRWSEFKYAWQHALVQYSLSLKIKQWMRGSFVSSYPLVLSLETFWTANVCWFFVFFCRVHITHCSTSLEYRQRDLMMSGLVCRKATARNQAAVCRVSAVMRPPNEAQRPGCRLWEPGAVVRPRNCGQTGGRIQQVRSDTGPIHSEKARKGD